MRRDAAWRKHTNACRTLNRCLKGRGVDDVPIRHPVGYERVEEFDDETREDVTEEDEGGRVGRAVPMGQFYLNSS